MSDFILYTMPMCPYCFRAKRFFRKNRISYQEKMIINPANFKEMREITSSLRVPIIQVNDRVLTGFDEEEYMDAFEPYIK